MAESRLDILITASNGAKASLDNVLSQLNSIGRAVGAIDSGQIGDVNKNLGGMGDEAQDSSKKVNSLVQNLQSLQGVAQGAVAAVKFLTGGFLALKSVQIVKSFADTAARAEVLQTVMVQVGSTAGYTEKELLKVDKAVQKLGITSSASRESIAKLIQSGLDLSLAAPLARAAQDLAVVAGWNSSDTFQRLIVQIQQQDTLGLRFMGLIVNKEQIMAKATAEFGGNLSQSMKQLVFANAVLEEAAKLTGVYEHSMRDVGKQLTSLPRLHETLSESVGQRLLPVYSSAVALYSEFLELLISTTIATNEAEGAALGYSGVLGILRDVLEGLRGALRGVAEAFEGLGFAGGSVLDVLVSLGIAIAAYKWGLFATGAVGASTALLSFATNVKAVAAFAGTARAVVFALQAGIGGLALALKGAIAGMIGFAASMAVPLLIIGAITLAIYGAMKAYDAFKQSQAEKKAPEALKEYLRLTEEYTKKANEAAKAGVAYRSAMAKLQFARDSNAAPEEIKSLQAEVERLSRQKLALDKETKALQKLLDEKKEILDRGKGALNDRELAQLDLIDAKIAAQKKAAKELEDSQKSLQTTLTSLGISFESLATNQADKFVSKLKEINSVLDQTGNPKGALDPKEAANWVSQMLIVLNSMAGSITTEAELLNFRETMYRFHNTRMVKELIASSKTNAEIAKMWKDLELKIKVLNDNAAKALATVNARATGGKAPSTAEENARARANALYADVKRATDAQIAAIAEGRKELENQFKLNIISYTEYYDALEKLIISKNNVEIKLLQANEDRLRKEYQRASTKAEKTSAKSSLDDAVAATQTARLSLQNQLREVNANRAAEERKYAAEKLKDEQELLSLQGFEIKAKQDALNAQLQLDLAEAKGDKSRQDTIFAIYGIKYQELTLEGQLHEIKVRQLAIAEEEYNLQTDVANGTVDIVDAETIRTEIMRKQVGTMLEELAIIQEKRKVNALSVELQTQEAQKLREIREAVKGISEEELRRAQANTARVEIEIARQASKLSLMRSEIALARELGELTSAEARARNNEILKQEIALEEKRLAAMTNSLEQLARTQGIFSPVFKDTLRDIDAVTGRINNLKGQYVSLGKEIRNVFTNTLAEGINGIIERSKTLKDVWNDIVNNITKTINQEASKQLAEQITKMVIKVTKDSEGKSVFDFLGDLFAGKPDGTPAKPMHVVMTNPEDIAQTLGGLFGGGGSGGGIFETIGGGIASIFGSDGTYSGGGGFFDSILNFFNGYAEGGLLSGAGTGTSDSIPIAASNGEYIMTADQTRKWLPVLEMMRQGRFEEFLAGTMGAITPHMPRVPKFAGGGLVTANAGGRQTARPIVQMTINTPDANSFRRSKDQIAAEYGMAVNRVIRRNR